MKLTASMEFQIPDGAYARGKMEAGTRNFVRSHKQVARCRAPGGLRAREQALDML
jgi:hypothetical protein